MSVSVGTWLGVAALIVAIIAIPASIWGTRQWGNRRARAEFEVESIPLLPRQSGEGLLEVTYRNIAVPDPHLVSVVFRNTGPRDISSAAFDNGRPISIGFDQTFYGLTSARGGGKIISSAIGTPAGTAVVQLEPGLLKRGEEWSFSAVLSGPVEISVTAPLVDTDIAQVIPNSLDVEHQDVTLRISAPFISAEIPLRWSRARSVSGPGRSSQNSR